MAHWQWLRQKWEREKHEYEEGEWEEPLKGCCLFVIAKAINVKKETGFNLTELFVDIVEKSDIDLSFRLMHANILDFMVLLNNAELTGYLLRALDKKYGKDRKMEMLFDRSKRKWNLMDRTLDRYIWVYSVELEEGEVETVCAVLRDNVTKEWLSLNGNDKMISSRTTEVLRATYNDAVRHVQELMIPNKSS